MHTTRLDDKELQKRAWEIYETKLRFDLETEENIGKMLIIDVDTGDYEMGEERLEPARLLQLRHPPTNFFGICIGYTTASSFAGGLERIKR